VEMIGGEALPEVNVFTPGQEDVVALGQISGYLMSDDTGGAISGARVSVEGTEQGVVTDEDGFFSFELPRGEYKLLIADPNYGKRDVSGVRVMGNVNTGVNLNMSLDGDGVIEEVVAVGSYIPSTAVAQQRDSSAVLDAIGSEQFSRFGDSSAASALKRVSGVTIADGKYAVVRGLNERYSTVQFNGANIPSPDPSRRVVPLDIFPSGIISTLNVQKSGSADKPATATGASIDIISKEAPEEFEGKLSVLVEYAGDVTGESFDVQKTSGSELLGYGSDDRAISSQAKTIANDRSSVSGQQAVEALDLSQLKTTEETLTPNTSMELTFGDMLAETDYGLLSYQLTGKYKNEWDVEQSDRASYNPRGNDVSEADEYEYTRVVNDIELDAALTLSIRDDDYTLTSNTVLLRQTQNENVETIGVRGENRNPRLSREFSWRERQFFMQQFFGEHLFSGNFETELKWALTLAEAEQDSPDSRSYAFVSPDQISEDDVFNPVASVGNAELALDVETVPERRFDTLEDSSTDVYVDAVTSVFENDSYAIKAKYGVSSFSRERTAESYRLQYELANSQGDNLPVAYGGVLDISNVVNEQSILAGVFDVDGDATNFEDSYEGTWDYTAFYIQPSFEVFDLVKVDLGLRSESSKLEVETKENPGTGASESATIDESSVYPSLNITYFATEELQLRFAYYSTVNLPDFREVAPAQFTDPITGDLYKGNKNLQPSDINSIDFRAEYYFSENESVTFALFNKTFTDTIERNVDVIAGSAGTPIYSYANAGDGNVQGIELGFAKDIDFSDVGLRASGNLAVINSEVDELNTSGLVTGQRDLQGQADILANVQLALDEYNSGREYTLVFNHTGESLDSLSTNNQLEDQIRAARNVVDINFKQPLMDDRLDLKAQIKNITNEKVLIEQNGRMVRSYKPGVDVRVGISYKF